MTESDILKDIPVFGLGFKTISLYNKITESFFTKKLLKFLYELKDIPKEERENFVTKLESDKETKNAGEKLLIVLNRLDDVEKSTIIGKLLKATILGEVNYSHFKKLTHIIDKTYLEDLKSIKNNPFFKNIDEDTKSVLHSNGVLTQSIEDNREYDAYRFKNSRNSINTITPAKLVYKLNTYGDILNKFGL